MQTPSVPDPADEPGGDKKNFRLGVGQGASVQAGASFIRPSTFLAAFVHDLSGSCYLCGLIFTIQKFCQIFPQLLGARFLKTLPYHKPFLVGVALLRGLCWVIIGLAAFLWGTSNPKLVITTFFVCLGIFYTAGGLGLVAFNDFTRKVIDRKVLGSFFGWRSLVGGVAAVVAAMVARWILSLMDVFPRTTQHTLLFVLAAVFFVVQIVWYTPIREPPAQTAARREPLSAYLKELGQVLKAERWFHTLILTKFLLSGALLATPFYVTFATKKLGQPLMTVGTYTILLVVAQSVGGFIWGKLSDRRGQRFVLLVIAFLCLLPPFFGLLAGLFHPLWLYAVFFSLGLTLGSREQMERNYMTQITPEGSLATYSALQNTLMAPVILFPIIGAYAISVVTHLGLFLMVMTLTLAGIGMAFRLPHPKKLVEGA